MKSCKTVYAGPEWAFAAARPGNRCPLDEQVSPEARGNCTIKLVSSMSILSDAAAIAAFHRKGVQSELHVAIK